MRKNSFFYCIGYVLVITGLILMFTKEELKDMQEAFSSMQKFIDEKLNKST